MTTLQRIVHMTFGQRRCRLFLAHCCFGMAIGAAGIIFLWIMLILNTNMNGLMAVSYSIQPEGMIEVI